MGHNWRIQKAAVEQEILFPSRSHYDGYIDYLNKKGEIYEVLKVSENQDGSVTVLMRKRYNNNRFLSSENSFKDRVV